MCVCVCVCARVCVDIRRRIFVRDAIGMWAVCRRGERVAIFFFPLEHTRFHISAPGVSTRKVTRALPYRLTSDSFKYFDGIKNGSCQRRVMVINNMP